MEGFIKGRLAIAYRKAKVIISWQYHDEAVMPAFSAGYEGYLVHHRRRIILLLQRKLCKVMHSIAAAHKNIGACKTRQPGRMHQCRKY